MIYIIILVCISITMQAASHDASAVEPFTAQTICVFNAKITRGYTDVEQSDRDAADSDLGIIYQQFAVNGVVAIAQQCPLFMQQAHEQKQLLMQDAAINQYFITAQQSVHDNIAIDERVDHWNKFRFSFDAVHKLSTQRSIKKIEIKPTPYETMIANEYHILDEQQKGRFIISLLVTALNLSRIDTVDTDAFTQIFKDDLNPTSDAATVQDVVQPKWQLPKWLTSYWSSKQ